MTKVEFASETVREQTDVRELTDNELESVTGGHKAGGSQQTYLVLTLKEVFVSQV